MGPLELLEKVINEHGSANILREHLALVRARVAELEREKADAQTKGKELQAQLNELQAKHQQASTELQRLQGLLSHLVCDHCGSTQVRRAGTRPEPGPFGELGARQAVLRCDSCNGVSYIPLTTN